MYVYDILLNPCNVARMYVFSDDNLRSQYIRKVIYFHLYIKNQHVTILGSLACNS